MEAVRLLPQHQILKEWWQEVKENFWEDDAKPHVQRLVKELMESTMKEELVLYTRARPYERTGTRSDYRNGYYPRSLVTQFGAINGIKTPRLRKGGFKTKVFKRYHRYQDIVENLIQDIFLAGISTRRVGEAIAKLLDTKVSHQKVSLITRRLDRKVREFQTRSILDEYQYLLLDAITLKVRYNLRYHNRKVLSAYGVTIFGERRLLAFRQAKGESTEQWESFLNDLYRRGLEGKNLRLIIGDGSKALHSALELVYPLIPIQRCWAHKLRNVANYLPKRYQEECINQAREIYSAEDKTRAILAFKDWKKSWQRKAPKAVKCLQDSLEELLNFYDCPKEHRVKVRTTNVIERSFREVRRRTRVFSCFSNRASCDRIIYAIFTHLNNKWEEHPLKEFTQFS